MNKMQISHICRERTWSGTSLVQGTGSIPMDQGQTERQGQAIGRQQGRIDRCIHRKPRSG